MFRTTSLLAILSLTSACGMDQLASKGSEAPSSTNNPAVKNAYKTQDTTVSDPNKLSSAWPASGKISCTMSVPGVVSAQYVVSTDANSRVVTVGYDDALYQGHSYSGTYTHNLSMLRAGFMGQDSLGNPVRMFNTGGIANADAGAIWVDQADVAKDSKGYGRGWGFALDITTMTLWGNPGGSVGKLGDWSSTDCHFSTN